MNLVEKIKTIFTRKQTKEQPIKEPKTLENIELYDDVILVIDNKQYKGWISDLSKTQLVICYDEEDNPFKEIVIPYSRPYNRSVIEFNNKKVYLNE